MEDGIHTEGGLASQKPDSRQNSGVRLRLYIILTLMGRWVYAPNIRSDPKVPQILLTPGDRLSTPGPVGDKLSRTWQTGYFFHCYFPSAMRKAHCRLALLLPHRSQNKKDMRGVPEPAHVLTVMSLSCRLLIFGVVFYKGIICQRTPLQSLV